MNERTMTFSIGDQTEQQIRSILITVYDALKQKGYNPINQIVGYLISGDPGYISSYKDARNKIQEIDRAKIVEILLVEFHKNKK